MQRAVLSEIHFYFIDPGDGGVREMKVIELYNKLMYRGKADPLPEDHMRRNGVDFCLLYSDSGNGQSVLAESGQDGKIRYNLGVPSPMSDEFGECVWPPREYAPLPYSITLKDLERLAGFSLSGESSQKWMHQGITNMLRIINEEKHT